VASTIARAAVPVRRPRSTCAATRITSDVGRRKTGLGAFAAVEAAVALLVVALLPAFGKVTRALEAHR
jgi:hypothetical protein